MMQKNAGSPKDHFVFLDYLRILATWAVVWDHVVASWPDDAGSTLQIVAISRSYINGPFGIIQDFGWIAVTLFFLVSGFIITHVATRESTAEFLIKRFFRIFPLLAVFVIISIALNPEVRAQIGIADLLRNMTLINYLRTPQVVIVGVAWTLVIEILFYLLTPLAIIATARQIGSDFFLFAASMAYVPYLVVGQIFYLGLYRRSISLPVMAGALLACFSVIIYGIASIHTSCLPITNSYIVSFVDACFIFYILFQLNQRLKSGLAVRFLAATSFTVYLVHGVIGRVAFDVASAKWSVIPAVMAALGVTAVGAAVIHLTLEKPFLDAGRRLSRRFSRRGSLRGADQQTAENPTPVA